MNRQLHCGLWGTVFAILLLQTVSPAFAEWPGITLPGTDATLPVDTMSTAAWPEGESAPDDATKCVIASKGGTGENQIWVYAPWATGSPTPSDPASWRLLFQETCGFGTVSLSIPEVTVTPSGIACVAFVAHQECSNTAPEIIFVPFTRNTTVFPPPSFRLPWYWSTAFTTNPALAQTYAATEQVADSTCGLYTAPHQIQAELRPLGSVQCGGQVYPFGDLYIPHTSLRIALATRGTARFCFAVDSIIRFYDEQTMVDADQYEPDSYFEIDASTTPNYGTLTGRLLWRHADQTNADVFDTYELIYPADRPETKMPIALDAASNTACVAYWGGNGVLPPYTSGLYITRGGIPLVQQFFDNYAHSTRVAVAANGTSRRIFVPRNGVPDTLRLLSTDTGAAFTDGLVSPNPTSITDAALCDAAWSTSAASFVYYWYSTGGGKYFRYHKLTPALSGSSSILPGGGGVGTIAVSHTIAVRDSRCEVFHPVYYHDSPDDLRELKFNARLP